MESIVHSAVEEICCEAAGGLHLSGLWAKLQSSLDSFGLSLCENVKRGIWENLIQIPGLKFVPSDTILSSNCVDDWSKLTVEEVELINVKIVAPEDMRKSFLGICEIESMESTLSDTQHFILQRLTVARTNGIAQNELAKELKMEAKNLFYPLKRLEALGLIVKIPAMVRTNQSSKKADPKSDSIVHTNMLYLYRYGKHLSSQQRLEIRKETDRHIGDGQDDTGDDVGVELDKEDIHVQDFLPAMKAICSKLENAEGKVLVVYDIKRDLGYRGSTGGHRAWRNICHRLKDAQIVEECSAMVNEKMVNCLRLLKNFSPSHFEPKNQGRRHNDDDMEQCVGSLQRAQVTNQVVELPMLRQIYDTIEAAGSKGLTNGEVCRDLGLDTKDYHRRYFNQRMFRFGLHSKREIHNRSEVYRLYTAGNLNLESCTSTLGETDAPPNKVKEHNLNVEGLIFRENVSEPEQVQLLDASTSIEKDNVCTEGENDALIVTPNEKQVGGEGNNILLLQWNPQNSDVELPNRIPDEEPLPVNNALINNVKLGNSPSASATPPRVRSYMKFPCLTASANSLLREQHILKMLQDEKFLIKPELHRRLETLEKGKNLMDRKTLERSLNKLQQEGHCKCITVNVPAVTKCSNSRKTVVVLHPSVYNVSAEVLGQKIYDKLRDFEIQSRSQIYPRPIKGRSTAVLDNVERTTDNVLRDAKAKQAEQMRANGLVLAKMIRSKLLHIFLWGWISSFPAWNDALLSSNHSSHLKNPYSTCKKFDLDAAIKTMPLELFLKIIGSARKFEDVAEKCRSGLQLLDLTAQEYEGLMDTQASARLSRLIGVLQRLKLIRLVSKDHHEHQPSRQDNTYTYALELIPYIEEPASTVQSSGFLSSDIRPQLRHDFVFSSSVAVEEYWNTLEYCYALCKPQAAVLAFPGSAVHQVYLSRSWVYSPAMTSDQHVQLRKRVAKFDSNRKISFRECEKIAKDLNLSMEQVLRASYVKRQRRFNQLRRSSECKGEEIQRIRSPRKRKRYADSLKCIEADAVERQSNLEAVGSLSEKESLMTTAEVDDSQLKRYYTEDDIEYPEEPESNEEDDDETCDFIHNGLSKLNSSRQKRFSWTEESDRKLVIAYARARASLGAKFYRVDWSSISNLPAHPNACKRRMTILNSRKNFKKAVLKLSTILANRYAKYLEIVPEKILNRVGSENLVEGFKFVGDGISSSLPMSWKWDDFDDVEVNAALHDALRYKRMAKLESMKDLSSQTNKDFDECGTSTTFTHKSSLRRKLPRKYVKALTKAARVSRWMHESVAIANAAELFKLIFLSSSMAPEVPNLLAGTLRRYSQHDLYAAFNYLSEKKIMIGGSSDKFMLSPQFLQSISPSNAFPRGVGKQAAMFTNWLQERRTDLMGEDIDVPSDIQCGETFALCALLSSGEVLMTPCLPDDGLGEVEEIRTSKRKHDGDDLDNDEISKKSKTAFPGEAEHNLRKEKGFPGIRLSLQHGKISKQLAIEPFGGEDQSDMNIDNVSSQSDVADNLKELLDSAQNNHLELNLTESPWVAMAGYAGHLMSSCSSKVQLPSLHDDLFKTLYSAIQKSGDHGLSMKQIHEILNISDENVLDIVIEVLEVFGRALKVNGFDSIRVVDSLYRSKYFLTSAPDHATRPQAQEQKNKDEVPSVVLDNHTDDAAAIVMETNMYSMEVHKVTILNQHITEDPPEVSTNETEFTQSKVAPQMHMEVENIEPCSVDSPTCKPLFPWMNGDGSRNERVYNGLIQRLLGIVMQNPGMLEDGIINQMHGINPQNCRKLLEILIMDNHIIARRQQQMTSSQPPAILGNLLGSSLRKPKMICRVHYYANPMSITVL